MSADRRLRATYRLQLGPDLGFADAVALLPHLEELGVSHLYLSPILAAVPGSTHGYDVVDHERINPELGGDVGWAALVAAAHARNIGLVVDIVPNHMAVHPMNRQWWDVLRRGRRSRYATWFDIFWENGSDAVPDRLLLPVLPDHYGAALTDGTVRLDVVDGEPVVRAGGVVLPLDDATVRELAARGTPGDATAELSADRERLHEVLERQHYRLAHWHTGSEGLDYRRFFDVTDLIGVRAEDPEVFADTHRRILELVAAGDVDGLRVDHVDGLADPTAYTGLLRDRIGDRWLVVEKILGPHEHTPKEWPVDGTTGYETGAVIDALLVDRASERALTATFAAYTGEGDDGATVVRRAKGDALDQLLPSELHRLADDLVAVALGRFDRVDVSHGAAVAVLRDVLIELPVYRTYARGDAPAGERDRAIIAGTVAEVSATGAHDPAVVDLVLAALTEAPGGPDGERFRRRFQQTSGSVTAKGVEDTAGYRYVRLVSLNDVGGAPERFGVSVDDFHAEQLWAASHEPRRMVTTSTHDSKRSEDVRARIAVLSEVPEQWRTTVERWAERCALLGRDRDPVVEYLLHQTIVGASPISVERLTAYAVKAAREAKRRTSWLAPDEAYELALTTAVTRWLTDADYVDGLERLLAVVAPAGRANALVAKVLALTLPGIPDLYQGSEWWTDSLVDPDNRRPVDHAAAAHHDRSKLDAVRAVLATRRRHPDAFDAGTGTYAPLRAQGPAIDHVVAFVRGGRVATVASRLPVRLAEAGGWRTTTVALPPGSWRDVCRGRHHEGEAAVGEMLASGPVAVLERA